jgi:integrase
MENTIRLSELSAKYLQWCSRHRSPRTVEWYQGHLDNFMAYLKDESGMPAPALKPYHVMEWTDSQTTWGPTYKGGAIISVKRLFNWGEEMGFVSDNPIKKLKKPTAQRRKNYMKPEDYEAFLALLPEGDPFRELFIFTWLTGCRPQEVRHIEARHVDLDLGRIIFPAEESKGKRYPRRILISGVSLEIITRLVAKYPEGKLFRNTRGGAWEKYAICNRFDRMSKRIGKRMACYDMRHGFATRKLKQGVDSLIIAAGMGHRDGSMLNKVYSHVDEDEDFLKQALAD